MRMPFTRSTASGLTFSLSIGWLAGSRFRYQGEGDYQGIAAARDAVKKEALARLASGMSKSPQLIAPSKSDHAYASNSVGSLLQAKTG